MNEDAAEAKKIADGDSSAGLPPANSGASRPGFGDITIHKHRPTPQWAFLISTFFGVGRLPGGPGTWASAITVLLWAALAHPINPSLRTAAAIGLTVIIVAVAIPAATQVSRHLSKKDPQIVVIDEVAGQLIALIAVPLAWKSLLAGFILFRAFDIVKPPPVRQLEALPEGWGIVLDDVAAGVLALGSVHLLLHFGLLT